MAAFACTLIYMDLLLFFLLLTHFHQCPFVGFVVRVVRARESSLGGLVFKFSDQTSLSD